MTYMDYGKPRRVDVKCAGHYEAETVLDADSKNCVVTLVERKTG